jgi:excisionase family DNA binding protein
MSLMARSEDPRATYKCNSKVRSGGRSGERPRVPRFLTIDDIAQSLDVSTRTVRRLIKSGALVAHRIGGVVRVAEADFLTFLAIRRDC